MLSLFRQLSRHVGPLARPYPVMVGSSDRGRDQAGRFSVESVGSEDSYFRLENLWEALHQQ